MWTVRDVQQHLTVLCVRETVKERSASHKGRRFVHPSGPRRPCQIRLPRSAFPRPRSQGSEPCGIRAKSDDNRRRLTVVVVRETRSPQLEEVNHLLLSAGYGSAYPALRPQTADGSLPDNLLTDAMKISQQNGDYLRFDGAASSEFFYWGVTTLMGAQSLPGSHCRKGRGTEWKLCTPAELQARNPMFYALLTNPLYKLPTRLPDGRY